MCVSDEKTSRRMAIGYLADVESKFKADVDAGERGSAVGIIRFERVLGSRMDYFNNDPSADKMAHIQAELDGVRENMLENIDRILERGEKIELLVSQTEALNSQAATFKSKSTKLKRQMWWQNAKMNVIICIAVLIIIGFLIAVICAASGCGSNKNKKSS